MPVNTGGTAEHLRLNKLLSEVTYQRGIGEAGIGTQLIPLVKSPKISNTYLVIPRLRSDANIRIERAPGENVKEVERQGREYDTFVCQDRRIKLKIPLEISEGMGDAELLEEKKQKAIEILHMVETSHERSVHNTFWASKGNQNDITAKFQDIYGNDRVVRPAATSGFSGLKWDADDAKVREDVMHGMDIVQKACGYKPNTMVMTPEAFRKILNADNDFSKSYLYTKPGGVSMNELREYLGIPNILVPRVLVDGSAPISEENPEVAKDWMWKGASAGLFYVNPARSRNMITLGSSFYWDSPIARWLQVKEGWNENNMSWEVQTGGYFTVKPVDFSCGLVFTDIIG